MNKQRFILFARQLNRANDNWTRIRSTARTTNPVTLKIAQAKADLWKKSGWEVQAVNVETQEAQQL